MTYKELKKQISTLNRENEVLRNTLAISREFDDKLVSRNVDLCNELNKQLENNIKLDKIVKFQSISMFILSMTFLTYLCWKF